jgi:Na+-driven multidrug efflux pump
MQTIKKIYSIGGPSILMQAVGSFLNLSLNNILIRFTPTATAVFGVYFKLQSFHLHAGFRPEQWDGSDHRL